MNLGFSFFLMNIFWFTYLLLKTYSVNQTGYNISNHKKRSQMNNKYNDQRCITQDQGTHVAQLKTVGCSSEKVVPVYIITPTHRRSAQLADLTRLSQTLMHLTCIHWLVVEDNTDTNVWVEDILKRSKLSYTYMAVPHSETERKVKVRGCSQRNKALEWIKTHNITKGILYFADDDNSYDLRLFTDLRKIKQVGIMPTGNLDLTGISTPVVQNGKVTGFVDVWKASRKFPVEMASIGINIDFWLHRGAPLFRAHKAGYMETGLLEDLHITKEDLEPLANNCTETYVWHTQTVHLGEVSSFHTDKLKYQNTNIPKLMQSVVFHLQNAKSKKVLQKNLKLN